ncbi:MAG: hypothetical protein IJ506_04845 [Clostridia bacterium]|nr:hypothetical protein [Clostridia bacterium]
MGTQTNESVQKQELKKVKIFSLIFCGFAVLFILFALFLPIFERKIDLLEMSGDELLAILESGNIDKNFSFFDELCLVFEDFSSDGILSLMFIALSLVCGILGIPTLVTMVKSLLSKELEELEIKAIKKFSSADSPFERLKLTSAGIIPNNVRVGVVRRWLIVMTVVYCISGLFLTAFAKDTNASSYFASLDGANVGLVILLIATFAGVITFAVLANAAHQNFTAEVLKGLEEEKNKQENKEI